MIHMKTVDVSHKDSKMMLFYHKGKLSSQFFVDFVCLCPYFEEWGYVVSGSNQKRKRMS